MMNIINTLGLDSTYTNIYINFQKSSCWWKIYPVARLAHDRKFWVWLVGENGGNCSFCQICWTLYCVMFIDHCYWPLLVLLYLKPPTDQRVWYCSTISHHVNNLRKTLRKMWQNILFISASPSLDISYFEISPSKCVRKWLNWKRNMIYISIHIYTTP